MNYVIRDVNWLRFLKKDKNVVILLA